MMSRKNVQFRLEKQNLNLIYSFEKNHSLCLLVNRNSKKSFMEKLLLLISFAILCSQTTFAQLQKGISNWVDR